MKNTRQELLQVLIEKLTKAIHSMQAEQNFPFGSIMLKKQHIMILFFVYGNNHKTSVKDIASFLHVTPGAVTQLIDYLVGQKIVVRKENPSDRRSTNICLTSSTVKQFDSFRRNYVATASKSFYALSDKELKQFINLVEKISVLDHSSSSSK